MTKQSLVVHVITVLLLTAASALVFYIYNNFENRKDIMELPAQVNLPDEVEQPAEVGLSELQTSMISSSSKDMLHGFLGQAESLYVATQLASDSSSLLSKIKQCRLAESAKADCDQILMHLTRAVEAYKGLAKVGRECDRVCRLYITIDKHLRTDTKDLERLHVVFSSNLAPDPVLKKDETP